MRVSGPQNNAPASIHGSFKAYVDIDYDGTTLPLNFTMLKNGYGVFSNRYEQALDSISRFKEIQQVAENNKEGIWRLRSSGKTNGDKTEHKQKR